MPTYDNQPCTIDPIVFRHLFVFCDGKCSKQHDFSPWLTREALLDFARKKEYDGYSDDEVACVNYIRDNVNKE